MSPLMMEVRTEELDNSEILLTVLTGLSMLYETHRVTGSVADTIAQWHNAGGMVQYYDFPLEVYLNARLISMC